jgi:hypothetical protein
MNDPINRRTWLARALILIVAAWNIQAALVFLLWPENYVHSFALSGVPGAAAVRGAGVLFLMWNIPYLVALWNPYEYLLALKLAVAMQLLGLLGESYILSTLTAASALLQSSILRFITFDGAGLILLASAYLLVRKGVHQ